MINTNKLKIICIIICSVAFAACSNKNSYYDYLYKSQAEPENVDTDVFFKEAMKFLMERIERSKNLHTNRMTL